jgi:TonB family protein
MFRIAVIVVCAAAGSGLASGQEAARDVKDSSITRRPAVDQAHTGTAPPYPFEALRDRLEGRVSISTCIDASGKAFAPGVAKSSGHAVLDQAALDWTANGMRFKPAQADGQPVAVCDYRFVQEWKLPESGPPPAPGGPIHVRGLDGKELTLTRKPTPKAGSMRVDYPASAVRNRVEGDVTLQLCLDVNGKVTSAEVTKSSGNDALDRQSINTLKKVDFHPGEVDGKIVAFCGFTYFVTWRLPP